MTPWILTRIEREVMKVYLDDIRTCPEGWELARTVKEAIEFLRTGKVIEISLDFDLGYEVLDPDAAISSATFDPDAPNGGVVAKYIRDFHGKIFPLPVIHLHTANPEGYRELEAIKRDIERGLRDPRATDDT